MYRTEGTAVQPVAHAADASAQCELAGHSLDVTLLDTLVTAYGPSRLAGITAMPSRRR